MEEHIGPLRKLNLIMRFSYTLPFVLASLCGVAYGIGQSDDYLLAFLIPLDVLFLAMFVNFSNDYFDYKSGVDAAVDKERFSATVEQKVFADSDMLKRIYWEGNQFERGLITERQGRILMVLLLAFAVITALPIIARTGLLVLLLGLIAIFLAYFYTAPPLNMGARGLGELTVGIAFFMLVFFSHYVLTSSFEWEIMVFAIAIGLAVGLMRAVDSISGYESHLRHGEKDLAVRMGGREKVVPIIKSLQLLFYVILMAMVAFHPANLMLLFTLPLAARSWRIMDAKADLWYVRIAPYFFGVSVLTMILYIIALSVRTFLTFPIW
ncbi:MAG: 1,4-dihydroxy-2-naphthoate polyprenyltransferase [Candidatus Methanomethylophilaceae archaeon]|nr:1,4-dihydroxy-2-naphthoate polyprenyltransferase [Candidatus Methanomethylophilaceae archaeon]MDI3541893.1 1,4-dihydroxy-2-naphthoate polyprenyltransferase [Candidatus Methanomethylophilaceae archaeon]